MKTIYLLHSRLGGPGVMIAFECEECAKIQAAWYRRDKVTVIVIAVPLYTNIRDATAKECPHLKRAAIGKNVAHEHAPVVIDN